MRIVMVTDDVEIDRRILAEARTLIEQGHELILLAASRGGDATRYEIIAGIKVERAPSAQELAGGSPVPIVPARTDLTRFTPREWALRAARIARRAIQRARQRFTWTIVSRLQPRIARFAGKRHSEARWTLFERWVHRRLLFYRPDIIHAHDLPQLRSCATASLDLNARLVYDAHELYPEISTLTPSQSRTLSEREAAFIRDAQVTITVNEFIAEEMARRYGVVAPVVIWNAIDPPSSAPSHQATLHNLLKLETTSRILLFQGWMSRTRGLQDLVRAMARVQTEIHLVFMGYGEARKELEEIASKLDLSERVHFLDAVPVEDLVSTTATADVGIIPYQPIDLNNRLCSPNKLFEYIQAHVPIIANDLPFLRKIIREEGFGLVHELSTPEAFAIAIRDMFDEAKGGPERFKAALRARSHRYSWSVQAKTLLSIYEKLSNQFSTPGLGRPQSSAPQQRAT